MAWLAIHPKLQKLLTYNEFPRLYKTLNISFFYIGKYNG